MDLYFDAARWWNYWFIWNPQYNTGTIYDVALAAQGFHALPAFFNWAGFSVGITQKVQWVFWFTIQGLGIAYLLRRMLHVRYALAALWVAVSFYLFNLYQETVWIGFDIAKISASVALPCLLAEYLALLDGSISLRRAIVTISGFSLLGVGVGANPPLTLVVAGAIVLALVAHLVTQQRWRSTAEVWRIVSSTIKVAVAVIACHAFWLFPLLARVGQGVPMGGQVVSANWLDGVSVNTSFANVCRLQGDWTWYQGWKEPYRPYAALYQQHPVMLVLSWCLPVLVLLGIVRGRHPHKLFFFLLTVFGLGLSMGSHPPTGPLYRWLVEHVPFFWTLRSPWNKFTLWTTVGYAMFLGLAVNILHTWFAKVVSRAAHRQALLATLRALAVSLTVVLVSMNLVYAFPVTLGKVYVTAEQRQFLPPNHVRIPEYIWAATRWVNQQVSKRFCRVLALPEAESWTYGWGLGSSSPALLQLGAVPVLYPLRLWATPEQPLLRTIYRALYQSSSNRLALLLRMLNVGYVLHETDLQYWIPAGDHDDPPFIRTVVARQQGITRGPTFGAWEWHIVPDPLPQLYHLPTATLVIGGIDSMVPLTQTELLTTPGVVMTSDAPPATVAQLLAARAFDSVVVTPESSSAFEVPDGLPVYVVAASDHLNLEVDPTNAKPLDRWVGFDTPRRHPDGTSWRSLVSNNATNWTLENLTARSQRFRLEGTVVSPKQARSLYAYLDQKLLEIVQVPAEITTPVALNVTLPPGLHTIAWYSPNARSQLPDGRQVGFEFADDWRAGPPVRRGAWRIPRAGAYTIRVASGAVHQTMPRITIGGQDVVLREITSSATEWVGTVVISLGVCPVYLRDVGDAPLTMVLTPRDQAPLPQRRLTPVVPRDSSPTTYQWRSRLDSGWLIFSEAYHPGWTLRPHAIHIPINGFANAYYSALPRPTGASLVFDPQRWVILGGIVSLSAGLVLVLVIVNSRSQRQP